MLFQFLLTKFSKSELVSYLHKVDHVTNYCKRLITREPAMPQTPCARGWRLRSLSFAKAPWCHQEAATKQVKSTYESSGPSGQSLSLFLWHEMTRNILFFSSFFPFPFFSKSVLQGAKKLSPREIKKTCVSHQPHPQSRPYNWPLMRVFFTHAHHNIRAVFQSTRHMACQRIIKGPLGQVCQNIIFIFVKAWFS